MEKGFRKCPMGGIVEHEFVEPDDDTDTRQPAFSPLPARKKVPPPPEPDWEQVLREIEDELPEPVRPGGPLEREFAELS